jgi:hypothetical protein
MEARETVKNQIQLLETLFPHQLLLMAISHLRAIGRRVIRNGVREGRAGKSTRNLIFGIRWEVIIAFEVKCLAILYLRVAEGPLIIHF